MENKENNPIQDVEFNGDDYNHRIVDRFLLFLGERNIKVAEAERMLNKSYGYFSKQKLQDKDGKLGANTIESIAHVFPDLDINWLVTGEHKSFNYIDNKGGVNTTTSKFEGHTHITIGDNALAREVELLKKDVDTHKALYEQEKKQNEQLRKDIDFLQGLIKDLKQDK